MPEDISESTATFLADQAKFNQVVNGTPSDTVVLGGGTYPTLPKVLGDLADREETASAAATRAEEAAEAIEPYAGAGAADHIDYDGRSIGAVLDALLYAGLNITTLVATPAQIEVGGSANVVVTWTIGGTPTSQTINGTTIPAADRTRTFNAVASSTTYTLVASDANAPNGTVTDSEAVTVSVLAKWYAGVASSAAPTDAQLRGFASSGFATTRARTLTFNASGGSYPCYAWPASLGALSSVRVGGLAFSDYTITTRNVVNAAGGTVSMNILVFNTLQNGASIEVQFA